MYEVQQLDTQGGMIPFSQADIEVVAEFDTFDEAQTWCNGAGYSDNPEFEIAWPDGRVKA